MQEQPVRNQQNPEKKYKDPGGKDNYARKQKLKESLTYLRHRNFSENYRFLKEEKYVR